MRERTSFSLVVHSREYLPFISRRSRGTSGGSEHQVLGKRDSISLDIESPARYSGSLLEKRRQNITMAFGRLFGLATVSFVPID